MEYGLGPVIKRPLCKITLVLILVLMEYGLGHEFKAGVKKWWRRLNPCFNGIWSRTSFS